MTGVGRESKLMGKGRTWLLGLAFKPQVHALLECVLGRWDLITKNMVNPFVNGLFLVIN